MMSSLQVVVELLQDWPRTWMCDGIMEILKAHSPYGIQVRFSKWAPVKYAR
jgi:hypothetical protein